ncbi:MAG: Nif3-like dinuclear metal center hexameric protein [Bacilli bacterium]|nr:Nif3-like dinuclear metal center hexameric protein [Bacilli bacterium]
MNGKVLIKKLEELFPVKIAKKYNDFVGLMVGTLNKEVKKILICLDFDDSILNDALKYQPDIIITHHPFIYGKKKQVLKNDFRKKELVNQLEANNISIYSLHTNFDEGNGGMNDALCSALELTNIAPLSTCPMARGGSLKKATSLVEFCEFAKERLKASYGNLIDNGNREIKRVAIIGGGGSRYWKQAQKEGYDIFISGDISHHIRREIILSNYNYLDLPHEIEKIFIPTMKKIIKNIDSKLEIKLIDHEKEMKPI